MEVVSVHELRTRVNTDRSVSLVNQKGIELCRTVPGVVPTTRSFSLGWSPKGRGYEIRVDGRVMALRRDD